MGSKNRAIGKILPHLQPLGDVLVDVFGGSGAIVLNSDFPKRIYNDLDADFVDFFRTLRDNELRPKLVRYLRNFPMSRLEYEELAQRYVDQGLTFSWVEDPVERAAMVFYRSSYAFGGKIRDGGFAVSAQDRLQVKELGGYRNRLRKLAELAQNMRDVVLENLDFEKLIRNYGKRKGAVLYCDPPYFGCERYYSQKFEKDDHRRLAELLLDVPAAAVVSYYRFEGIEELYPKSSWRYETFTAHKNRKDDRSAKAEELLLIKR